MFSIKTRTQTIEQLKKETLDLLIIGGGITGAGVAIQAAASGVKTGLIEMQDFSEGTSSRSTKLVHGGIRYLKNFDVEVVSDTVTERAVVQQIAPHIPKPDPMLLPIYEDEGPTTFNLFSLKIAMDLYDRLAGITESKYANYTLNSEEVLAREPYLKKEGLVGGGVYLDFKNNDARLVIDNIKKAHEDGGLLASKVKAVGFLYDTNNQIIGVKARDLIHDETFEIHSKLVINTSGPWVDKVRQLNFTRAVVPKMRPTKGIHLVVDAKKLPIPQPTYFDTGKQDGRMVFAIPRENKTYLGTTDTDYQGDYTQPRITQEDVDYLLEIINYRYPKANIQLSDIESSWAGLRPLLAGNASSDYNGGDNGTISDKSFHQVIDTVVAYKEQKVSRIEVESVLNNLESKLEEKVLNPSAVSRGSYLEREADGLITLAGGKITDYRKMAAGAMLLIQELLKEEYEQNIQLIDSKNYPISGGDFKADELATLLDQQTKIGIQAGLSAEEASYLSDFYGTNALKIFQIAAELTAYEGLSLAESARLKYSLEEEMTLTPCDYFIRRTNHLLFMRDTLDELILPVLQVMNDYFKWSTEEYQMQKQQLEQAMSESDLNYLKEMRK